MSSRPYKVRKSFEDTKTQLSMHSNLETAKAKADENPGYKVFDEEGNVVYSPKVKKTYHSFKEFLESIKPTKEEKEKQDRLHKEFERQLREHAKLIRK